MAGPNSATLRLLPFRAVRYHASDAELAALTAPPYDVIDEDERRALEAAQPHNVVRLILPRDPNETSEPPAGEPADPSDGHPPSDRYASAAQTFDRWLDDGILGVDAEPALYVYQQSRSGAVIQRGLLGAVVVLPLDGGVILPHENVRTGPVEDRLALMRAMEANPEPIFLLYDGGGSATTISAAAVNGTPLASAQTADGILHQLWSITDSSDLAAIAADLAQRQAMIADGHHRYTTYGYLRDELHAAGRGPGPWDAGLALLVDDSVATPDIRAIHRVVPGLSFEAATAAAASAFRVERLDGNDGVGSALALLAGQHGPAFVVTDGDSIALLRDPDADRLEAAKPAERTAAWWALDASIAGVFVMETLWGVSDAAGQVEAEHDPEAALRLAKASAGIALLLNPAPLAGIMAVAAAGDAMPRKSTLFLPKPRSGIVMRSFRFDA
ncbi:MAG: hypothetical protein QOG69_525 [Actinomycetota bacterium]|nr:hypothetical protein [Actinomycetota bacterium]